MPAPSLCAPLGGHPFIADGFGSQSGYNYDLDFALSWVNNHERFVR